MLQELRNVNKQKIIITKLIYYNNYVKFIIYKIIAEAPKPTEASQPSDRDQYRRAPEAGGAGDKKGEAGAGSFEFVS